VLTRLKGYTQVLLSRSRRTTPVRWLHEAAAFVENAYANSGSNLTQNGELALLQRAAAGRFEMAIDVGANEGDWMAQAVKLWPACHVHAFEVAAPTHARLLEKARTLGMEDRVTIHAAGLSDHEGAAEIFYYPDDPSTTAERHRHTDKPVQAMPCVLQTGDAFLTKAGIERVDFLKIDVEGAEYKVLQGFGDAVAKGRVLCIQFEYGAFSIDTKLLLIDYYALLGDRYWIGKIYPAHIEFQEYDWRREDFRFSNYCCVLKTRPDLRRLLEG
jgi:FkbM family methyltransferase